MNHVIFFSSTKIAHLSYLQRNHTIGFGQKKTAIIFPIGLQFYLVGLLTDLYLEKKFESISFVYLYKIALLQCTSFLVFMMPIARFWEKMVKKRHFPICRLMVDLVLRQLLNWFLQVLLIYILYLVTIYFIKNNSS